MSTSTPPVSEGVKRLVPLCPRPSFGRAVLAIFGTGLTGAVLGLVDVIAIG